MVDTSGTPICNQCVLLNLKYTDHSAIRRYPQMGPVTKGCGGELNGKFAKKKGHPETYI